MRLVGGSLPGDGRVDVCINGRWGRVCEDSNGWSDVEARVVCRQSGYLGGE